MNRPNRAVIAVLTALMLIASAAVALKGWIELRAVRQDLRTAAEANDFLRKTVGNMTVALAGKDREIDRLTRSQCEIQVGDGAEPKPGACAPSKASPQPTAGNRPSPVPSPRS